jgi:hypothetical protein
LQHHIFEFRESKNTINHNETYNDVTTKGSSSTEFLETDNVSRVNTREDLKVSRTMAQFVAKRVCKKHNLDTLKVLPSAYKHLLQQSQGEPEVTCSKIWRI